MAIMATLLLTGVSHPTWAQEVSTVELTGTSLSSDNERWFFASNDGLTMILDCANVRWLLPNGSGQIALDKAPGKRARNIGGVPHDQPHQVIANEEVKKSFCKADLKGPVSAEFRLTEPMAAIELVRILESQTAERRR